jgi:hypothetical protein
MLRRHTASAQTVAEYTKRVDSLAVAWRSAVANQIRDDSIRSRSLPTDTIRLGNFVILSDTAHAGLARATAAIVSPELDRTFGSWAARMRSHVLVVRRPAGKRLERDTSVVESGIVGPGGVVFMTSSYATTDALAAAWRRKAEEYLTRDLDPVMRDWLGTSMSSEPVSARGLSRGRVDLVLAQSQAAHDCASGRLESCSKVLGLVPMDDPAFELFNNRERRQMIEWYSFVLHRRDPLRYANCVSAGNEATCDSLVRLLPADVVGRSVPPAVRLNFLRYALLRGGDGAFDRLARSDGAIADRIAAAAHAPIDSVVSQWQANLISSPSSSTAIDVPTALSSLFWACACGALALRSSRWR